jgi:small neutral amino acid transporter SnatA (MarC family)
MIIIYSGNWKISQSFTGFGKKITAFVMGGGILLFVVAFSFLCYTYRRIYEQAAGLGRGHILPAEVYDPL